MSSTPSNSKPLVLITGATGHLGFRTLVLALQAGYQARVAIRKLEQADWMLETTSIKPFVNDVSFVRVADITASSAYDEAIKGVKYAIHVASPIPTKPEHQSGDWRTLYYEPATNGTVSLLSAAAKTSSVEAVVITSSVAILRPDVEIAGPKDIQPNLSASDADRIENFGEAYAVSKVLAYHAAKDFMDAQQPLFKTVFVLPGYIQGPNELLRQEKEFFSGSNEGTINAITGNVAAYAKPASQVWLDDAARAHVVALQKEEVHDGDTLVVVGRSGSAEKGSSVHWDEAAKLAAKEFPAALEKGILKPVRGQQTALKKYDVAESEAKFGFEFSGPEMWVKETAAWWLKWHGHEAS
ncbi:Ketoreductase CTB6 [Pseudocercospora fuligena]|uniref:Ketoreductase CTB6 n=1 Tax=Pseudocercospora fuligena TaxID=685502 RepID=A0A8H6VHA7_9PEZI|nr:Ketoreductase CTB6 [Pseudocercospora fuligena]